MPAIDDGRFVEIYGVEQWVTIRGGDLRNPVLILVSGPGVALSRWAPFFEPWERDFTLVQWDQPGAGATFAKAGESGPLTLDRIARDGVAVVEFARRHLRADAVAVVAVSAGTIIGLKMLRQRAGLFSAYVGSGQVVSWRRQATLSYEMVLAEARAAANREAVAELEQIGPPPYADVMHDAIKGKYAGAMTPAEQAVFAALDPAIMAAVMSPPADANYVAKGLPSAGDPRARALAAFTELRDEIAAFDAGALGLAFDVPMFFFQGERDAYTVTSEVQTYVDAIQAPAKAIVIAMGGGHSAFFLRDEMLAFLRTVIPLAARLSDRSPSPGAPAGTSRRAPRP